MAAGTTSTRIRAAAAVVALALGLAGCGQLGVRAEQAGRGSSSTDRSAAAIAAHLKHWPRADARRLGRMIARKANTGAYAVFDADNTTYRYDLEESLLPFMENKGVLTRATMDPALKIIPFRDVPGHQESLYSYYDRLCEIDDQVCYPWVAQIFAGFTLRQLKGYVDQLMASGQPIPAEYYDGDTLTQTTVNPPQPFTGMQELYRALRSHHIRVFVMSAASEELVRMVLSDPKYGYDVRPRNVIGVTTLLKDPATGSVTTARKEIAAGTYRPSALLDRQLTSTLWAPLTWFQGKPAGIKTYIDQWREPVLVAGDTPSSDGPMLFQDADVRHGGLRVWVNRKDSYLTQIRQMQQKNAAEQRRLGQPVTAKRGWVYVKADQLGS